jgi:hypothetical protein
MIMKNKITNFLLIAAATAAISSCQKIDRPELGEVITDEGKGLPTGPLRFYTGFNKTDGPSPRWNALDSVSGSPALLYPLDYTDGINGKAMKGKDNEAALYMNANDFDKASSFSIAFWIKNPAQAGRTEFLFSLVQPNYSWTNSAAFVLVEHQTATSTTMKFGLKDQWLEGTFNKPMFDGSWHHMVYSYDNTAKKMTYYFDGQEVTGLTATQTNMNSSVNFTGITNLILGGWNKHAGQKGPTDDWVKSFSGSLDQFRLYDKALTSTEVQALFNSKL